MDARSAQGLAIFVAVVCALGACVLGARGGASRLERERKAWEVSVYQMDIFKLRTELMRLKDVERARDSYRRAFFWALLVELGTLFFLLRPVLSLR